MAKKSTSGHHRPMPAHGKGAARKPQVPERSNTATLVRSQEMSPSASNVVAETPKAAPATPAAPKPQAAPAARQPERRPAAVERAAAPKPTTSAPSSAAAAAASRQSAVSGREQQVRLARARATQQARRANLIAAENYAYVLGDLKLVAGLAITAFVVLIALTFVLPH